MTTAPAATQKSSALAQYYAKKAGLDPNSTKQMSLVSDSVTESLQQMVDMAKARQATAIVKEMAEPQGQDPVQGVAHVVGIAKDLASIDESRQRSLREEADKEREHRRYLEQQVQTRSAQGEGAMMQVLMTMMAKQEESTQRWMQMMLQRDQQHKEEMRILEERLEGRRRENPEHRSHPLDDLARELLVGQLTSQPKSAAEQLQEAKQLINTISPPTTGSSNLDIAKLQHDLSVRQLEKEQELKREELQARIQIEQNKAKNFETIASALSGVFGFLNGQKGATGAPQQATGTGGIPGAQGAPAQPQAKYQVHCTNEECDKYWETRNPGPDFAPCIECGSPVELVGRLA